MQRSSRRLTAGGARAAARFGQTRRFSSKVCMVCPKTAMPLHRQHRRLQTSHQARTLQSVQWRQAIGQGDLCMVHWHPSFSTLCGVEFVYNT